VKTNGLRVANIAIPALFFAGIAMFSAQAWAYTTEDSITYDTVGTTALKMDLYRASKGDSGTHPALFYIHGGCFDGGSRKDIPEYLKSFADDGVSVFSVDYRLSTQAPYPTLITDIQQAVRFIRTNAARFQIDPEKIVIHGESAGGYLAALLGVHPLPDRGGKIDEYSKRPGLISDWFGRTDFTLPQKTGRDCALSLIGVARSPQTMSRFENASVLPYVDGESSEFFVMQGTQDPQVDPIHSALLASRLHDAKRPGMLTFAEGEEHGFVGKTPWALTRGFILRFFKMEKPETASSSTPIVATFKNGVSTYAFHQAPGVYRFEIEARKSKTDAKLRFPKAMISVLDLREFQVISTSGSLEILVTGDSSPVVSFQKIE
jgi:acetyl esterase/lipase